jgi:16S rRNA (uracil1498-N3)-methyltransferase
MKLHRFYIPKEKLPEAFSSQEGEEVSLSFPELVHQLNKVLKLRVGEKLIFFTGNGTEYVSELVSYQSKSEITFRVDQMLPNNVSFSKTLYLFFSIIKKDNTDWILEKGTEIGVSHFVPIISSRCEKKDLNIERAERIVIEATEQCGRNMPPTIHSVIKLEDIFETFPGPFIVLERDSPALDAKELKEDVAGILIGPEGGWTKEEFEMFKNKKNLFRSLGPATLRAETAAIVGSAKILV